MRNKWSLCWLAVLGLAMLTLQTCTKSYSFRANYTEANQLLHETGNLETKPFLKAHLKNGDIFILEDTWAIDTVQNTVSGTGTRYDFNRNLASEGALAVAIDSVAIFETNRKLPSPESDRIIPLSIMAGLDVVIGILCITNPKACFGSCPTFYLDEQDNFHYADAEGFSNAISPSMEYGDIDALGSVAAVGDTFSISMKNEALETHCVNEVKLLAYPKTAGKPVFQSADDAFFVAEAPYPVRRARGPEGDITDLVRRADRQERFSLADEANLSSKEVLYLDFDPVKTAGELGLVVSFRQTLMTTYFIYSAIGYMGDEVGDIFAKLETEPALNGKLENGIKKELGDIEVYTQNDQTGAWVRQGELYETGPIAINQQIVPLTTAATDTVRLKIVMNRGLWRIDYLGLTTIQEKVDPVVLSPQAVLNHGQRDARARAQINDPNQRLISMPGSAYRFDFVLPEGDREYDLFLYTKGYYLEWMRAHWLKDKNLLSLWQMVEHPATYLKSEAAAYKQYETNMEHEFWNSKIDTDAFSYHDN